MAVQKQKKINGEVVRWIAKYSGTKGKVYIAIIAVLQMISGLTGAWYALLVRNVVDEAVEGNKEGFFLNAIYFVALVLFQLVLAALVNRLTELSKSTMENAFKERLFDGILRRDFAHVCAVHSGEWLNRLTSDTKVVADGFTDIIPSFCGMVVRFISALVMILVIDWKIAAILIPCGILLGICTYALRGKLKSLHKEVQATDGLLRIFLQENIASLMLVRSFAAEEDTMDKAREQMEKHKKIRMKRNTISNLTSMGFRLAMNGMYIFGICYGGYGILQGEIGYGTLMALTQLINQLQAPIVNITGTLPRIFTMTASAERLMEIEKFDPAGCDERLSKEEVLQIYRDSFSELGLRDVEYTYFPPSDRGGEFSKEKMPVAVSGVTLNVEKGQYVAFSGHSGCGKSTIIKLLMNIYTPDKGEEYIRIGETEEPLTEKWRNLFAYVPQGNFLMSGTIRDIVSFANPEGKNDDAGILEALRISEAKDFIDELEDGIDTLLGERGTGLSEGQMQRIAIARAVYSGRPVMLLDEATSALDEKAERAVLSNLRAMTDKTVIIITHRPAAFEICDKVVKLGEK